MKIEAGTLDTSQRARRKMKGLNVQACRRLVTGLTSTEINVLTHQFEDGIVFRGERGAGMAHAYSEVRCILSTEWTDNEVR